MKLEIDPERDYYAILGVSPAADEQTIKKAYRQLHEAYDPWRRQQGLDRPLALVLRTIVSHEMLPCLGESQSLYALVKISAAEEIESRRMPINLCLVLDRSTSMKGARLQQVKEAARYIVDQLGDRDILSVISFSDRAEIVLPGQWPPDKAAARAAISRIQAAGGTELLDRKSVV